MKSMIGKIVCSGVLCVALSTPGFSQEESPGMRESGAWMIFTTVRDSEQYGVYSEMFAIRKCSVLSLEVEFDHGTITDAKMDGEYPEGVPEAEREDLPAYVSITTDALRSGGGNESFSVHGLTYGEATELMETILETVKKAEKEEKRRAPPVVPNRDE